MCIVCIHQLNNMRIHFFIILSTRTIKVIVKVKPSTFIPGQYTSQDIKIKLQVMNAITELKDTYIMIPNIFILTDLRI